MHPKQYQFVRSVALEHGPYVGRRVCELGARDVNGSVRPLFEPCECYDGVDAVAGPGVDHVELAHLWRAGEREVYDVVLSCEMLEHDPYWRETLENAVSLLRAGGLLILTCAGPGRPEHGTPRTDGAAHATASEDENYYRNLGRADLEPVFGAAFDAYAWSGGAEDLYFWGVKHGPSDRAG